MPMMDWLSWWKAASGRRIDQPTSMVARAMLFSSEYGIRGEDGFIAWSPLFHMAATDHSLATLMLGGQVFVCDGLDLPRICDWAQAHAQGWLLAMPGMIEQLIEMLVHLERWHVIWCGSMT